MQRKQSGYSLNYDPSKGVWFINEWSRLTEFEIHTETVTEDFASYAEAEDALKALENQS